MGRQGRKQESLRVQNQKQPGPKRRMIPASTKMKVKVKSKRSQNHGLLQVCVRSFKSSAAQSTEFPGDTHRACLEGPRVLPLGLGNKHNTLHIRHHFGVRPLSLSGGAAVLLPSLPQVVVGASQPGNSFLFGLPKGWSSSRLLHMQLNACRMSRADYTAKRVQTVEPSAVKAEGTKSTITP